MATWQEEMAALAEEAAFNATMSGACGWCTDEGDEFGPAVFEYSRLDALTIARAGALGEYAKDCANSRDTKKQLAVSDYLASPERARVKGVIVKVDVTERQLGKAEFFARRDAGIVAIRVETGKDKRAAELEWNMREAEAKTDVRRDDPTPNRIRKLKRVYRNLCNRDRKG